MTAQIPHVLENDHPRVRLDSLWLYHVMQGSPWNCHERGKPYRHAVKPATRSRGMCTANYAGFIGRYRLRLDGRLVLERFVYPFSDDPDTEVGEILSGDYHLVMKERFIGPRTYIPFRDGLVVEDRARWWIEGQGAHLAIEGLKWLLPDVARELQLSVRESHPAGVDPEPPEVVESIDRTLRERQLVEQICRGLEAEVRKWPWRSPGHEELLSRIASIGQDRQDKTKAPAQTFLNVILLAVEIHDRQWQDWQQRREDVIAKYNDSCREMLLRLEAEGWACPDCRGTALRVSESGRDLSYLVCRTCGKTLGPDTASVRYPPQPRELPPELSSLRFAGGRR